MYKNLNKNKKKLIFTIFLFTIFINLINSNKDKNKINESKNQEKSLSIKFLQEEKDPTSSELVDLLIEKYGSHKFTIRSIWHNDICITQSEDKIIIERQIDEENFYRQSSFYLERGLDCRKDCFSFRSASNPNHFIRYSKGFLYHQKPDGTKEFDDQASFRIEFETIGDKKGYTLESCGVPGEYLSHTNWMLLLMKKEGNNPDFYLWNFDKALSP